MTAEIRVWFDADTHEWVAWDLDFGGETRDYKLHDLLADVSARAEYFYIDGKELVGYLVPRRDYE